YCDEVRIAANIAKLPRTSVDPVTRYSAGTGRASHISRKDCRKIWIEEFRNKPAIIAATIRSGHFVAVPQTAKTAIITATFPMASFREHNQTERTLASPSL